MSYRSRPLLASVIAATLALAACDSGDKPIDRNDDTLNRNIDSTTTTPGGTTTTPGGTQTDRPYGDPAPTTYPDDAGGAAGSMDTTTDGMSDGTEDTTTTPQ